MGTESAARRDGDMRAAREDGSGGPAGANANPPAQA